MQLQRTNKITQSVQSPRHPSQFIFGVKQTLHKKLIKEYSTSQGYFFNKIIDDLVQKKQGDRNCINTVDVKFDDEKQHMEKYYSFCESGHQFPELLEYYKYYSQDSICFLNQEFGFLAAHHDKKKAVLYQQLKKQLNISDSQQTLQQVTAGLKTQKFDNVLSGLQLSYNNDESYLVNQILKKLVNHYGPSRVKTINKIDSEFKFMTHNLAIGKSKNIVKQGPSLINPQTMLESTNTSVRNNCYLKQKKQTPKNTSHRRFGSCEVPKSPNSKNSIGSVKDKKNRIRRRKSAQLLSYADVNVINLQNYKKSSVKTQEQNKCNKVVFTQTNFRQKMQQLRKKIRLQKQNLNRKVPQSACMTKKKLKK